MVGSEYASYQRRTSLPELTYIFMKFGIDTMWTVIPYDAIPVY